MNVKETRERYADQDLAFYRQVYKDYARADWCLGNLGRHYAESRVIVISDGDPDPRFERFMGRYNVEYHAGERLYPLANGGRIIERMLSAWGPSSDYLFKIDPDTLVRRRFRWLPTEPLAVFGNGLPTQGGCMGFTRAAGERLLRSGILTDDVLTRPADSWAVMANGTVNAVLLKMVDRDDRVRTDWLIGWCCRQLGIPQLPFDEVCSRWREPIPDDLDAALTHPHKEVAIDRDEL